MSERELSPPVMWSTQQELEETITQEVPAPEECHLVEGSELISYLPENSAMCQEPSGQSGVSSQVDCLRGGKGTADHPTPRDAGRAEGAGHKHGCSPSQPTGFPTQ